VDIGGLYYRPRNISLGGRPVKQKTSEFSIKTGKFFEKLHIG
jgi:hypothetical protein